MAESGDPNILNIKVKMFDDKEYFNIRIDWSDVECKTKQQQVFHQLAAFTGIPVKYTMSLTFKTNRPNTDRLVSYSNIEMNPTGLRLAHSGYDYFNRNVFESVIHEGDRFILDTYMACSYDKHLYISYFLIDENLSSEKGCTRFLCRHKTSRAFTMAKMKLITSEKMAEQLQTMLVNPEANLPWPELWDDAFIDLNIAQYRNPLCIFTEVYYRPQLYLRMRG
ncbi:uncharacterized protein LOC107366070 [Tetranychus urticae]|uniref:uncharacterized protein LOC107366070 n=1 Tax=Tetranychus urticae TaxID=32264 RepID=UPI00077BD572|nr:uncharacterized protein LOC107366070 [Tetranychus urticae]